MVSRETRTIGIAIVGVFALALLYASIAWRYDPLAGWSNFVGFLLFAVLGIVAPQVYLVRTDESIPAISRHQISFVALLLLGGMFSGQARTVERLAIWTLVGGGGLLIIAHYFLEGYRSSRGSSHG